MRKYYPYSELAPSDSRQLTIREAAEAFRPGADPDEGNAHAERLALQTALTSDHAACPHTIEVPGVAATPDLLAPPIRSPHLGCAYSRMEPLS